MARLTVAQLAMEILKRKLNEIIGDPWNTSPRQEEKPRIKCGVYVTLERQIRYGGQKGCMACCRHAGANPRALRIRAQDTVNNEVAQNGRASSIVSPGKTPPSLSSGIVQSSSSGTAPAAGRPAPEVGNVAVATVAESSTTQPTTSSTFRETEIEDQSNAKRQRVLASRPDQHGTDVNADVCKTIVLAAGPEDRDGWTQQVVDRSKRRSGDESGHLGHLFELQKMSEDRTKELAKTEKLDVAEITLQEARTQILEIVYVRWVDNVARRTPEDPDAGQEQSGCDKGQHMRP